MQSAPDTKHDLFFPLSNANQPPPSQLESFVDQLRNVCHQLEQVDAIWAAPPGSPQQGWWEQVPPAF